MLRRIGRGLRIAGFTSFALTVFVLVSLSALSYAAPPMMDERPVDYDAEPSAVVENTTHNLLTAEYTYSMTITETDVSTGERKTVKEEYTAIDNGAQTYYSEVQFGKLKDMGYPPIQYYGNGVSGYSRGPEGLTIGSGISGKNTGKWEYHRLYRYESNQNIFEELSRLGGAEATVVSRNETTYVVRVTNDSVIDDVVDNLYSRNKDLTLTIYINTRTDTITNAVIEYRGQEVNGRAEYEFNRYGSVHVSRPTGAYPPRLLNVLQRLDMGIRALTASLSPGGVTAW